ncbi:MAG: PAS domain-containing protein [Gemmatimonadales bacterium]|nr:PAS domain-containing protein [Gemmatimonadales bacterium]
MHDHLDPTETELHAAAQARQQALAMVSADILWTVDDRGYRHHPENTWPSFVGQPPEAVEQWRFLQAVHPDDREGTRDAWARAQATGVPFEHEHRIRRADGAYRRMQSRAVPRAQPDGRVLWFGASHDVTAQREAEAELAQRARRHRALLDASDTLTWGVEPGGRLSDVSERWAAVLGAPPADLDGWLTLVHTDDADRVRAAWSRAMATGEGDTFVCRLRQVDGAFRWMRTACVPVADATGRVVEWVGGITDIHELHEAERLVEAGRERLRLALEATGVGIYDHDVAGDRSHWSPHLRRLLRLDVARQPEPRLGDWIALIVPEDRPRFLEMAGLAREGREFEREYRMLRGDGTLMYVRDRGRPQRDASGTVLRVVGVVEDVTEARLLAERLAASEERLALAVQATGIGIYDWDVQRDETTWSPQLCRLMGEPEATPGVVRRLEGRLARIVPDDRERFLAAVQGIDRGPIDIEYRVRRPDGAIRHVRDRAQPHHDADGQLQRVVGAVEDVTAQRELEARVRTRERLESLGTLAGGIAHEFNNILGVVLGYAELLELDDSLAPSSRAKVVQVQRAGERARALVQQILSFSRRTETQLVPLDLRDVVRSTVALLRSTLPSSVTLETRLPGIPVRVAADATQLVQALVHLAANAERALRDRPEARLAIALALSDDHATLTVSDNGCGMAPDVLARAWDPFFTTRDVGDGSGLGLAVVRGVAEAHGGSAHLSSALDGGTRAELRLPRLALAPSPGSRGHVLLVDDEPELLEVTRLRLAHAEFTVEGFTNPREALARFEADPDAFDIVVTDQTMPHLTGDRLVEAIRRRCPELPVVVCTGYGQTLRPERLAELGVGALLEKPATARQLATTLERVLASARG